MRDAIARERERRPQGDAAASSTVSSAAAPALQTSGLAVGHSSHALVSGVDIEVGPGQICALIGPNGSGKTTVLKTLAAQLQPVAGTVSIFGEDLRRIPAAKLARTQAALFTERPKTDLLTCLDIVEAGRYPYTGRLGILGEEDRRCVQEMMEATGTWELRDRDFSHMSDGQRQRALIARALVQQPRILLLDEPTSYLDVRSQLDMLQLLRERAREQRIAVVTSLHEIGLAQKAADTVVCIKYGSVMCQGTPDEIFRADTVERLYGLEPGAYSTAFGALEMPRPAGAAEVFVIAGGGTGAETFRALQRHGVPFAAGVLHRHDTDGELARSLAAEAVLERDFEPVGTEAIGRALELAGSCPALICCPERFGYGNAANARLVEDAKRRGVPVFPDAASYLAWREGERAS